MRRTGYEAIVVLAFGCIAISHDAQAQAIMWYRQFGSVTSSSDSVMGVDSDGNIYVLGTTQGALPGEVSAGGADLYVRKYDRDGVVLWTRQFGTSSSDQGVAVSVDATGVYVAGYTTGTLPGQTHVSPTGSQDAFVRKYDAAGGELWTRQFGTSGASSNTGSIATDASGVYVLGATVGVFPGASSAGGQDAYLRKYDPDGTHLWTRQFGTSGTETGPSVATGESGVAIVVRSGGAFPGQVSAGGTDAVVRLYDADGNVIWTRQFGTSSTDNANVIVCDGADVYVVGTTFGALPGQSSNGIADCFVRKYDSSGTESWTRQFGTSDADQLLGAAARAGEIFVVGSTGGVLGQSTAGSIDAFVRGYAVDGTGEWTMQFGTASVDSASAVTVNDAGIFVGGRTSGTLPTQTSSGGQDAFLVRVAALTPIAVAGPDQIVDEYSPVLLDASASFDPEQNFLTYSWVQTGGPSVVTIPANDDPEKMIRFIAPRVEAGGAVLTFELTANDGTYTSLPDAVQVFVRNTANDLLWINEFGIVNSSTNNSARAVAVSEDVYVGGVVPTHFADTTSRGLNDAFVRQYDRSGQLQWTDQFGSSINDVLFDISASGGRLYAAGESGVLPGESAFSGLRPFLRAYGSDGSVAWTVRPTGIFDPLAVHARPDGAYVAGRTPDPNDSHRTEGMLRKFDAYGNELWQRSFGSHLGGYLSDDYTNAVTANESMVFVAGSTEGALDGQSSLGGSDAFLIRYESDGTLTWILQFGTPGVDHLLGLAVDSSGVYAGGAANAGFDGEAMQGIVDGYVRKFDLSGQVLWTTRFGAPDTMLEVYDIAPQDDGLVVTGYESLQVEPHGVVGFLRKLDLADGHLISVQRFGSTGATYPLGIAVDGSDVLIAGSATGVFHVISGSVEDSAFVARFGQANTPAGQSVAVSPAASDGSHPAQISFSDVTQAGNTSIAVTDTGEAPPAGYSPGAPPVFYDISTTATYDGNIEICLTYDENQFQNESGLRLFHGPDWQDVTTSLDTTNNVICGNVSSLSPFAIFEQANAAPHVDAGVDRVVDEGQLVSLDASASGDADGDVLGYHWTQIAGPTVTLLNPASPTPSFTAPVVAVGGATLTFQLIVSDGTLFSEPDTVDIIIKNVNHAPVADAGVDQAVAEQAGVTLDGSNSFDPDADTITFNWVQTDGPAVPLTAANTAQPNFDAPLVGPFGIVLTFELTVSDGTTSRSDTVDVVVENVNHDPTADAGPDQTRDEGLLVTLSGLLSSDPDGDSLTYAWVQLPTGGPSVTLSGADAASPTFTAPDVVAMDSVTLTFALTVDDGYGGTATDTVLVTVLDTNAPPDCGLAQASTAQIWPPNHKFVPITITGVTDPEIGTVTIRILGVTQDEPTNGLGDGDTPTDAVIQANGVLLRAERAGGGNGRVYRITFEADDGVGGVCTGAVTVCVPHDKRPGATCVDDGQTYNSLGP